MNSQNWEAINQVKAVTKEIKRLKAENQTLLTINEAFGEENDQLREELKRFQSFRVPRSLQSSFSITDESDHYELTEWKKTKQKHNDEGSDSESARVCNLLIILIKSYMSNLLFISFSFVTRPKWRLYLKRYLLN